MKNSDQLIFKKLKLTDIASHVGVSTATVSRTLTKPFLVRESVRARIQIAIDELGYQPNASARALAANRYRNIGVIVPTLAISSFAAGVGALQGRLSESNYILQLSISNFNSDHEVACVRELVGKGVDGIVMIGTRHDPKIYAMLEMQNIPYINTWDFIEEDTRPCIGFSNWKASYQITNYILDAGHKRVAIMAGGASQRSERSVARLEAALFAIAERGIITPTNFVIELPYLMQAGASAVKQLLDHSDPPTAVICTNDILAVGAILECHRLGVRIPDHLSITGSDDLEIGSLISPSLTTIHIPARKMGHLAAEYLIEKIEGRDPLKRVKLDHSLIVRDSVKKIIQL